MDHFCPVCNGLASLVQACSRCGHPLEDTGRVYDFYGDYSPYREIDHAKMDNGHPDQRYHQCLHKGWCPQCRREQTISVSEWTPQMLDTQKDAFK